MITLSMYSIWRMCEHMGAGGVSVLQDFAHPVSLHVSCEKKWHLVLQEFVLHPPREVSALLPLKIVEWLQLRLSKGIYEPLF